MTRTSVQDMTKKKSRLSTRTIVELAGIWLGSSLLMLGAAWLVGAGGPFMIAVLVCLFSGLSGLVASFWLFNRRLLAPVRRLADHVRFVHEFRDTPQQMPFDLSRRSDAVGLLTRNLQKLIEESRSDHAALLEQTLNDPLTGLGNRRMLESQLDVLVPLSRRLSCTVSAMMIDVDHFKAFNDHYGHPAGDACLVDIASVLKDTFRRETDVVVRLGGEEFLVLLINTGKDEAWALADAMRAMIQALGIPHEFSSVASVVTVSVGVVTSPHGLLVDIDDMIAHADEALYDCKARGRNQVASRLMGADTAPQAPQPSTKSTHDPSRQ